MSFSKEFVRSIGENNIASPYVEDKFLCDDIMLAYLNGLCIYIEQDSYGERKTAQEIAQRRTYGNQKQNNSIYPYVNGYIQSNYCTEKEFIKTKCNQYDISIDFQSKSESGINNNYNGVRANINLMPQEIISNDCIYRFQKSIDIVRNSIHLGSIHIYENGNNSIIIPFYIDKCNYYSKEIYKIGNGLIYKSILFENEVSQVENGKYIFVCEDPRIAYEINGIIKDSKRVFQKDCMACSYYSPTGSLSNINFSKLYRKNVIFIPRISRDSYINALGHKDTFESNDVLSYSILAFPVANFPFPNSNEIIPDYFEKEIYKNKICIKQCESSIISTMIDNAMNYDEYHKWAQHCGIIVQNKIEISQDGIFNAIDLYEQLLSTPVSTEKTWDQLVSIPNITIIHGKKNSGKSLFLITMAQAIAHGFPCFGFSAYTNRKVLLIDAETGLQKITERMKRIHSAYPHGSKQARDNLKIFSILNSDNPVIDLTEKASQQRIASLISQQGANVVIFDNILSLCPSVKSSQPKWVEFRTWLRELEKLYGTAIVMAHHSNKDGDPAGVSNIQADCQNIIHVEGAESLCILHQKGMLEEGIIPYLQRPGCLFRLHISKSKTYPDLEHKKSAFFLPYDAFSIISGPEWINISMNDNPDPSSLQQQIYANFGEDFSEDKIQIMLFAQNVKKFTRSDIDKRLECSTSKSDKLLNNLVKDGYITRSGKGKQTRYSINTELSAPSSQ